MSSTMVLVDRVHENNVIPFISWIFLAPFTIIITILPINKLRCESNLCVIVAWGRMKTKTKLSMTKKT